MIRAKKDLILLSTVAVLGAALWSSVVQASVVVPTGCVVQGEVQVANRFQIQAVLEDPVNAGVTDCTSYVTQMDSAGLAVGSIVDIDPAGVPVLDADSVGEILLVPVDQSTGSLRPDGTASTGGLTLHWYDTVLASEFETLNWQAAGMVGRVSISLLDDQLVVLQQEFNDLQCGEVRTLATSTVATLVTAIESLPLTDLSALERPSCAACADGDYNATLTVRDARITYVSNSFDLNQPPPILLPVTDVLRDAATQACPDLPFRDEVVSQPLKPELSPVDNVEPVITDNSIRRQIIDLLNEILRLLQLR